MSRIHTRVHMHIMRDFPIGAHLARDPMPSEAEMLHDLEVMAAAGFNLVKLQVNWATTEPRPGELDLARFDRLIAHAHSLGLGVYLGFVLEHAPHWLYRRHPDGRLVRRDGVPVAYEAVATLPGDGKPGPCFDHAGVWDAHIDYLRRATAHLSRHPNIAIWSTWQEIGYFYAEADWLVGQAVCYCANTLHAFREFLKLRFAGDLNALNRAWRTNHGDWMDLMPTRTVRGKDTHPVDMAWLDFMGNHVIERILRARAAVVRAADTGKRPVFAHKGSVAIGAGCDRRYAACQDFISHSAYPAWFPFMGWDDGLPGSGARAERTTSLIAETWNGMALAADHLRSANPDGRTWCAEMQGGPISPVLHKGRVPDAADIRRWMLTGMAHGQCGFSFWVLRAEVAAAELNGFSLLDSRGDSTARFAEAARIGNALKQYPQLFAQPTCEQAPLAIVVDDANHRFHQSLIHSPEHLHYTVRGWNRLAFDLGIPSDFLFDLDVAERIGRYRAVVVPFPLLLREELAAQLAAFAQAGGTVIAECCPGRVDENAFAHRGEISPAARALFGVEQRSFQVIREPGDSQRWTPQERTWGEHRESAWFEGCGAWSGARVRPSFVVTTFDPVNAEPLAMLGEACVATRRRIGTGQAILVGSVLGHGGTAHRDAAHHAGIMALLALAGISAQTVNGCTLRRRIAADGTTANFLWNPFAEERTVVLPMSAPVSDLLGEELSVAAGNATVRIPGLNWRVLIEASRTKTAP